MNEHEKRAWVTGAIQALVDANIIQKEGNQIKVAQFGGMDPYELYGYGLDPGPFGGGYGRGGDIGTGPMGQLLGMTESPEVPQKGLQSALDRLEEKPGTLSGVGGGLGAIGGGLAGAGLGGLGGYYGAKALRNLFDVDVDPNTLATILGLVGGLTGAGAGGYAGARGGFGLTQPQEQG